MNRLPSLLEWLRDPQLARHAASERPAWLFAEEGPTLLFANPPGAALFGFATSATAAGTDFSASEIGRQIARGAATLRPDGAPRLERLRGLGTAFGRPLTCACSRIATASGPAILVVAVEPSGPAMPIAERARRLIEGGTALAAFGADDALLHATPDVASPASLADCPAHAGRVTLGEGASAITIVDLSAAQNANAQALTPAATDSEASVDLSPIAEAIAAIEQAAPQTDAPSAARAAGAAKRHPLRFVWETDAENRFTIASDEFVELAGPRTAGLLGRFWGEISAKLALDPEGLVAHAMVSRDTWSGIEVMWPTAAGERVRVELSGIPAFDRERIFAGYRGFGVCRDLMTEAPEVPAETVPVAAQDQPAVRQEAEPPLQPAPAPTPPAPPENVVPFPAATTAPAEPRAASVQAERNDVQALTSRLASRLKSADELARGQIDRSAPDDLTDDLPGYVPPAMPIQTQVARDLRLAEDAVALQAPILDALPHGVLIYRLNTFLYANPAFLSFTGHASLGDFAQAGGLDSLFIEFDPDLPADGSAGQSLRIAGEGGRPVQHGRLVTISLDGENAMALTLFPQTSAAPAETAPETSEELSALLDLAADGIVITDRDGRILEANRGAARLFGYDRDELCGRNIGELFAPESERAAKASLERLASRDAEAIPGGREMIGRRRNGGLLSLHAVFGRAERSGTRLCAVFRDITRWKDTEKDLVAARQQAEKASSAKSEFLAKISHEMRTPLNAIIGFSEVMMEERFGPVGNERYRDYLKDINTSGAHLVSLLNDLLDLSKIEAGKLELSFERANLNDLTQQSVAIMQAQANRARIIVRTALSMNLPHIVADARSVRQIILNLLSNSIKFTGAGGQVIVSTAATDRGDVVLRVRDTGIGMSDQDIETALQPFRQVATARKNEAGGTGLGLPLTKALVEANRARFSIKSAVNAGTLVEIVFPAPRVLAE